VLAKRRHLANVVIDNVCDGHYGLAGQEAAIMGLPVVVFNHRTTHDTLVIWEENGNLTGEMAFPFWQARTLEEAVTVASWLATHTDVEDRRAIRAWSEEYFNLRRLITKYWDPFVKKLLS